MSLKKCLEKENKPQKYNKKGQSVLEYAILTAIAITAFLAVTILTDLKNGEFTNHFNTVARRIAPEGGW